MEPTNDVRKWQILLQKSKVAGLKILNENTTQRATMGSHYNFRPGQQNKLVSEPPIAAPDEHAQLVEADQRFRAALGQAIAAGGERIEAVEATVQLKRRTKLPR
jgi:hypothetical protein